MFTRVFLQSRLPIAAAARATSRVPARFNSSTASSNAARVIEMARAAEKPSAFELSSPLLWAASGLAIYTAWNRIDEKAEDHVEKLLIV